jgi:tetratricopeptide (TPR) repeat protein
MTESETLNLANQFRHSGQYNKAEVLYDRLLSKEPTNIFYLFNKGLNNTATDPYLAFDLFEKVVAIDANQVSAYRNIRILSDQTQQHSRGLRILNNFLNDNPENIEVLYEKTVLLGNSGDHLNALLDFYHVLEYCSENEYPATLSISQIVQDIGFSKVQLRNKTFNTWIKDMAIHNTYRGKELIEFSYELPKQIFGNENYYFPEGENEGVSIRDLIDSDPQFISDAIISIEYFFVTEEIVELLDRNGIDVSRSRIINTVKIQTNESKAFSDLYNNESEDLEGDDEPLLF